MQIVELTYARTVNIGDYNSKKMEAKAVLSESENPSLGAQELMSFVEIELGLKKPAAPAPAEAPAPAPAEAPVKKKAPAKKKAVVKKVAPVEEAPELPPVIKEEAPKKVAAVKAVAYNREIEDHKTELSLVLNDINPEWRNDAAFIAGAKKASLALSGTDFKNKATGEILESFMVALHSHLPVVESADSAL